MRELLRLIEVQENALAPLGKPVCLENLCVSLQDEIEKKVMPEIVKNGLPAIKRFLKQF